MEEAQYDVIEEIEYMKWAIRDLAEIIKELDNRNRELEHKVYDLESKVSQVEKLYGGIKGYNEVIAYVNKYLDYTSVNILEKIE